MQKIPKEQLRKRFQILADTLQDVIFSENTAASIRKAAVLGDVEDSVTTLAEMVGLVLMGFLNPADFSAELQKELGITADIARQIESSLNAEVFSLVQTELKKLYPPTIKTPTVISPSFKPALVRPLADYGEAKPATQKPADEPTAQIQLGGLASKSAPLGGATAKLEATQPSISEFEKRFFKPALVRPLADYGEAKPASADLSAVALAKEESYGEAKPASAESYGEAKPKMKPVVPLPTYIQSQFQRRSSYAEATADKEPTESQYREKTEEKTPPAQPKPHPKISGNIIDLRNVNK